MLLPALKLWEQLVAGERGQNILDPNLKLSYSAAMKVNEKLYLLGAESVTKQMRISPKTL